MDQKMFVSLANGEVVVYRRDYEKGTNPLCALKPNPRPANVHAQRGALSFNAPASCRSLLTRQTKCF